MRGFQLQRLGQIMATVETGNACHQGMADNRIGVARLDMPEQLPPGAPADAPEAKV